jgi:signal transduction histidine kinase
MNYPSRVLRWLGYIGIWGLLIVICTPQLHFGGKFSWGEVFWMETVFWSSWGILSLGVFWLCRRLYAGARTWKRYAFGFLLGTIATSLLQPLLDTSFQFAKSGIASLLSLGPGPTTGFLAALKAAAMRQSGTNPFMFATVVVAWHAWRYSHDLRERKLKAAELEADLREARLQALRSQLNPHFLFNTLHSIAELVHEAPMLAEQLILRLGELLRKVLNTSERQEVTLAEEIEFIKAYVDIEQMRLGDRLSVEWNIAPEVLAARVPSLLLQPLVENAIQYGVASANRPGSVRILAQRDNGYLRLQVQDSGPGLDLSGQNTRSGIGLSNTKARLQTLFGEQQSFELISHHGLTVDVRLPISFPGSGEKSAALMK